MAYLDLTTFTEYDPNGAITLTSSATMVAYQLWGEYKARYYKDFGEGYFGDCEIEVESMCSGVGYQSGTYKNGTLVFLHLQETDKQPCQRWGNTWYGSISAFFIQPTNGVYDPITIRLWSRYWASASDDFSGATINVRYYMNFTRLGSDVTLKIYDDAARTSLIDTLTCTCPSKDYIYFRYFMIGNQFFHDPYNDYYTSFLSGDVRNIEIIDSDPTDPSPTETVTPHHVDFRTFTEVGDSYITDCDASGHCIQGYCSASWQSYAYKDYGTNFFGNIFTHDVEAKAVQVDDYWYFPVGIYTGYAAFWGVSNDLKYIRTPGGTSGTYAYFKTVDIDKLRIYISDFGLSHEDNFPNAVMGKKYYLRLYRVAGVLVAYIYYDQEHTELLDTLTITMTTNKLRYLYGINSYYDAAQYRFTKITVQSSFLELLNPLMPDGPSEVTDGDGLPPEDGAENGEWPTQEIGITIPDGESNVTVTFYNADGDTILGTIEGASSGEYVGINWNDLSCEEEYSWYVVIQNEYGETTSETWYFTCEACDVFTIASESYPTVHLDPPLWAEVEGKLVKVINRFSFWSESWTVHDEGIENEPLVISGVEAISETDDEDIFNQKFKDINAIMNLHEEVAISGLGDCVDGYYYIKRFRYATVKGAIRTRQWTLELEFSREKTW